MPEPAYRNNPGGDSYNAGIIAGMAGERGHVTLAATIVDTGKVDFQQRNWSKVPILGQLDDDGTILTLMGSAYRRRAGSRTPPALCLSLTRLPAPVFSPTTPLASASERISRRRQLAVHTRYGASI